MKSQVGERCFDFRYRNSAHTLTERPCQSIDPVGLTAGLDDFSMSTCIRENLVVPMDGSAKHIGIQSRLKLLVVGNCHSLRWF